MAQHLLHQTVPHRHTAGDGQMSAHRPRQPQEPDQARSPAIDLGQAPDEPHRLRAHEDHIHKRARADRRHHADAFRRASDFAGGFFIERGHEFALGDVDEVAAIDDFAREFGKVRAGAGGGGARGVEAG